MSRWLGRIYVACLCGFWLESSTLYGLGAVCGDRTFTLQSKPNLSPKLLLEELALECGISLILNSNAQTALEKSKASFSFHKAKLRAMLDTIAQASDTHYVLENGVLRFTHLQTQTFHINYIATARVGSSNTDVVYGQESQAQSLAPHTNYYHQNHTALGDDIQQKALAQGTQNPVFGKSGTKIYSIDELNFWGDLENELIAIIYQENDSYNPKHPRIIINKGAGLITISATPSQLARAQAYIDALQSRLKEQVQIDVQIFTIEHNDINTIGVNWGKLFQLGLNAQTPTQPLFSTTSSGLHYGVYVFSQDLSIGQIVQFLQEYGKTSSISNPKIITLNNQPAIISVGNVLRYSQSLIYQTSTNSSTIQNTGYQYPSVFSGVLLDVTPSIYNDEIILKINPSITAAKDPAIENQPQALSAPPNLSTNQLSSIVRIRNAQRVILGGLISQIESSSIKKLPLLGSIPLLKYLFSYKKTIKQKREMVIIITPTIIDNTSSAYTPSLDSSTPTQEKSVQEKSAKKSKNTNKKADSTSDSTHTQAQTPESRSHDSNTQRPSAIESTQRDSIPQTTMLESTPQSSQESLHNDEKSDTKLDDTKTDRHNDKKPTNKGAA